MRIGIVDLDTSHPQNWIPIERELGHEVVGVWDSGVIHPAGYADAFAQQHGIPRVFTSISEMAPEVDCVIIHGCDWDSHLEKARPFVEAGKAVLVDKPIAGKLTHLREMQAWVRAGARITGGSSLRFCYDNRDWLAKPLEDRGSPHTVVCGCGVDEFNYGIHAYSMLSGIMGPGIQSVKLISDGPQQRFAVYWDEGRLGMLVVGAVGGWLPFHATIVTEKGVSQYIADSSNLYRALLEATLPYLSGATDTPPVPFDKLIEPELCALAARQSRLAGGIEVALADLTEDDPGYDGAAFAVSYQQMRYPAKTGQS